MLGLVRIAACFSPALVLGLATAAVGAVPTITIYGTTAAGQASGGTTYTAGTIIATSTVQFDDGAVISGTSNIVDNGKILFNQSAGNLLTINNTLSGTGTLTLQNSGTLQLSGTTSLREIPLNMTVNANNGSLITPVASGTQSGILQFGQSGTGTLNVAGGYVTSSILTAGQGNGVGTINVSSGTLVPMTYLVLGGTGGGSGTLNVTGGVVGGPVGQGLGNGIQIARTATSSGLMTITSGSVLVNGNSTVIGELGSGTVSVNSGGFFKAGRVEVGYANTGVGTLTINASGSADFLSNLTVGGSGQGTFTVNGGLIQTRLGTIGASAGSLGTATITSGTWLNNSTGSGPEIAGFLTVGGSGTGSLTINNGGYVVVTGTFSRGANGTLTLNQGGTLQIGGVNGNQSGGFPYTVATTGTIGSGTAGVLVGDLNYAGTLKFAQNTAGASPTLTYNGNLSGAGDLVKTGTGTLLLGGTNSYTGGTTLVAGVISLNSANAIGTTGTISFVGGTLQATANNTTDYSSRFSDAANQRYSIDSNGQSLTLASDLTSVGSTFLKAGSGTVTLTGANTFTSGSVAAGTLEGSAASLATSGTFGAGTATRVTFTSGTANESWAGQMFGSGTFAKTGAGTLTLSGSGGSTTGTLLISEGAIRGTTANLTRNIVNNSQLTFDQTTSGTYARVISGTGNLLLSNSGTITFSGNNTLTGTATVASGASLVATQAGAMPLKVVNSGIVAFNNSANGTYTGTISGSGSLEKLGIREMILSGSNSYSGGTRVFGGTLIANTSRIQGDISVSSGGTFVFDQGTSGTFSGMLSGVGSFEKRGVGDLTLTATSTNSGAWTVSSGTLIGTSLSLSGSTITNNSAVIFDQATSGTYSSTMSGSGSLTKAGIGAVTLTGSSGYSGATTVSAGSLLVSGSLSNSAVFVNTGALLGGGGVIGQMVTLSGGTISPGTGSGVPGLFTIGGLSASAGGTTLLDIIGSGTGAGTAGVDYDTLVITGSNNLGYGNGTLMLNFGNVSDFADGTTFDLFGFTGSASGSLASILATGSGSYAGATFTNDGFGIWTSGTLANNQVLTFTQSTGQFTVAAAVPEPSTLALAGIGIGSAFWMVRRRRSAS